MIITPVRGVRLLTKVGKRKLTRYQSLREFIAALDAAGELVRIGKEVSADLEIAAISDLVMKSPGGGKALLFEKVKNSSMPVLVNAYGSRKRMEMALGSDPDRLAAKIQELITTSPPSSITDALKMLPKLSGLRGAFPKRKRNSYPQCQEVILTGDAVDLTKLPVLNCWPDDGGPFVTLPCVITKDPETGRQNVGMYRLQIYDKNTTGMHWHIHKDGSAAHAATKKTGKRMEIAVAIGTDPSITYAATAPLPRGIDEMMFAGFLRGAPIELAKAITVDLWVPADAEIILEGYVDTAEERIEGPFGDHTGYYSPADPYPVFHVTAITHRRTPVYFATVVGIPPMEDEWLGWATERLFLPLLQTQWPEVTQMHLPPEGVFHNLCLAAMDKLYPMQARRLMSGFWGAGQMSFTKIIAVLEEGDPVQDGAKAAETILNRIEIPASLVFAEGVLDALDHSSPNALWGGKMGIDATRAIPGEPTYGNGHGSELVKTPSAPHTDGVYSRLKGDFPNLLKCVIPFRETRLTLALLVLDKKEPGEGAALAKAALEIEGLEIAVAVEGSVSEPMKMLVWRALASIDPGRDVTVVGDKLAVDATIKSSEEGHPRQWPTEVSHPPEVVSAAENLARQLGLIK